MLSSYYDIWFVIDLLGCDAFFHLIAMFYLCEGDSNRQNISIKDIDYGRYCIEELKS